MNKVTISLTFKEDVVENSYDQCWNGPTSRTIIRAVELTGKPEKVKRYIPFARGQIGDQKVTFRLTIIKKPIIESLVKDYNDCDIMIEDMLTSEGKVKVLLLTW